MKKMLRRIITLVCVATLFIMPTTTAFADSNSYPAVIYDANGVTIINWVPSLQVSGDGLHTYFLDDMSNPTGDWYVPAGQSFNFQITTETQYTTAGIRIYKNDVLVSDYISSTNICGFLFRITPESSDNHWRFAITPYSSSTILNYAGIIY